MEYIELNSRTLTGPALDWAVAYAFKLKTDILPPHYGTGPRVFVEVGYAAVRMKRFLPSSCWLQGGQYIDQFKFGFTVGADGIVEAKAPGMHGEGATHLIAVARAIVASLVGDFVQVPLSLMSTPCNAIEACDDTDMKTTGMPPDLSNDFAARPQGLI